MAKKFQKENEVNVFKDDFGNVAENDNPFELAESLPVEKPECACKMHEQEIETFNIGMVDPRYMPLRQSANSLILLARYFLNEDNDLFTDGYRISKDQRLVIATGLKYCQPENFDLTIYALPKMAINHDITCYPLPVRLDDDELGIVLYCNGQPARIYKQDPIATMTIRIVSPLPAVTIGGRVITELKSLSEYKEYR